MTIVGSKGFSLSAGQRQRVVRTSLYSAFYMLLRWIHVQNSDIVKGTGSSGILAQKHYLPR